MYPGKCWGLPVLTRLRGMPGLLELVADFAGAIHGQPLRYVRELAEQLADITVVIHGAALTIQWH